jgi:hypothetical protein
VRKWFDPDGGAPLVPTKVRLTWEHLVSIGRSPISPTEKLVGWPSYLVTYWMRRLRARGGRIKARLRGQSTGDPLVD